MRWFVVLVLLCCVSWLGSAQDYGLLTAEGRMIVQQLERNSALQEKYISTLQQSYEQQRKQLMRTASSLEELSVSLRRLRENYTALLSWSMNYYARTQLMLGFSAELESSLEKTEALLEPSWSILDGESLRDIGVGFFLGLFFALITL